MATPQVNVETPSVDDFDYASVVGGVGFLNGPGVCGSVTETAVGIAG